MEKKYAEREKIVYKDATFSSGLIQNNSKIPNDVIFLNLKADDPEKNFCLDLTVDEAEVLVMVLSISLWCYQMEEVVGKKIISKNLKRRKVNGYKNGRNV